MAVQALFLSGVLTVHSGNAAPEVPEHSDDAVDDPSAPMDSANNLKQIAIAVHALDAGECSVDICAQNSPPATPEPVTHAGWGPWEVVLSGHSSSAANTGYVNPSSFQIVSAGVDAGSRLFVGNLAMHSEAISEPVQKGAWIADVTYQPATGQRLHSHETAGSGDHGTSILEFSVENFPNNSADPAPPGFGIDRGHMASSFELTFATQTTFPQRDGNAVATESLEIAHEGFVGESEAVTWTAIAMAESGGSVGSYSDYSLYDLLV
jgi:hypothetical protein